MSDDPVASADGGMAANVAAFEQTVRSTIALAETFAEGDWDLPTECPGWSVKDVVSHIVSVETLLLGEDPAPGHVLPDDLPHVRSDFGRMLETGVDARRPVPGTDVLAELRDVLERRLAALATTDPEQETMAPTGRMVPYSMFMVFRAFDCWVHEQDIRRAVGRPGNLDAPGAECARMILRPGLPMVVAKRAGASPGQSVEFRIIRPTPTTEYVQVGADGRGRLAGDAAGPPTTTLSMDWETYVRLAAGRCVPADVEVEIKGDAELGARVLAHLAITP
ncbi:maleylpyruvate isomerase family mycothiol-dependent enzyme [Actinomadura rudentiformis]|uniref:Maleylpyruvate isomerase family mycothiol-dependent enzyme n=1 Tax=Actinomadura rudentiformis TaxID=359158 RepID=A0A6H9YHU5_9ACTN|nr:maleylpyruvate isomerase family mycothiol-dependent enzyme [Actinomadura rudentiformis]KAB2346041.1 maleylpyruvate isomerase family mycothiol-dependent enzyme [Actinomadura rudentiformis]